MSLDGLSLQIEQLVSKDGLSYVEAMVHLSETFKIEVEELAGQVHPNIIAKIKTEFIKKNFFPAKKIDNSLDDFFKSE